MRGFGDGMKKGPHPERRRSAKSKDARRASIVFADFGGAVRGKRFRRNGEGRHLRGTTASGAIFIGIDRGYFAAQKLDVEVVTFDAGEAVAVATMSGAIDIGAAGVSPPSTISRRKAAGIISDVSRDVAGFQAVSLLASNRGWDGGLRRQGFAGPSVALTTIGSTLPLRDRSGGGKLGLRREERAQVGGRACQRRLGGGRRPDRHGGGATPLGAPLLAKGEVSSRRHVCRRGRWQVGIAWTTTATAANDRADMVAASSRHTARACTTTTTRFTGPGETRRSGPSAPEVLALIAKHLGQSPAQAGERHLLNRSRRPIDARDFATRIRLVPRAGHAQGRCRPGEPDRRALRGLVAIGAEKTLDRAYTQY